MEDNLEIKRTINYDKFSFFNENRDVSASHINRLKKSIEDNNLLHLNPIIVNENYKIVDGQNRFLAAKDLDVPIYYIQQKGIDTSDAITLNVNKKNWGLSDYLDYYIQKGYDNYVFLKKFKEKHNLSMTAAIGLLEFNGTHPNTDQLYKFREGDIELKTLEKGKEIVGKLSQLEEYWDFVKDRSFVSAFVSLYKMDEFDFDRLIQKCEFASHKLKKCPTRKLYIREIEDLYNYKSRDNVRFY